MAHSVGDAAARAVKKSEKQTEKANRTPEQRVGDIRKLAEAGLAVHTADVIFLLGEYNKLYNASVLRHSMPKLASDYTGLGTCPPGVLRTPLPEAEPAEPYIPETLQE